MCVLFCFGCLLLLVSVNVVVGFVYKWKDVYGVI